MTHKRAQSPQTAIRLGARGRIVLPARVRKQLGLRTGDSLIVTIEQEGAIRLTRLQRQLQAMQGMFRKQPKRILSRELIQDRKREAAREADD
jgi:AbrB family looped-hinge helix DNA binding protein